MTQGYSAGQPKLTSASDAFLRRNIDCEIAKLCEETRLEERKRLACFLDRVKFASAAKISGAPEPILQNPVWGDQSFPEEKKSWELR
jgi:hypothetical protein